MTKAQYEVFEARRRRRLPQTRSKQAQVWERRKSPRVLALLCYPNEHFVR